MPEPSEILVNDQQALPPFRPVVEMIEHLEGSKRWREVFREHARQTLANVNGEGDERDRT